MLLVQQALCEEPLTLQTVYAHLSTSFVTSRCEPNDFSGLTPPGELAMRVQRAPSFGVSRFVELKPGSASSGVKNFC